MFTIEKSLLNDLETILGLYRDAVKYQKEKGYNLWPEFEKALIEREINEQHHYKVIQEGKIACVFSVLYNDPIIWKEKDKDPAIYLHRIATNPNFKGKGMMQLITNWAHEHAIQHHKKYIRMDTWGDNENLKNYYIHFGFKHMGQVSLPKNHELPSHYWGSTLSLFEIKI
jgi:ribosomal protein S18 acetylase RimI-like enzyme